MNTADIVKRERKNFFFAYNMIFDLPLSEHAKVIYMCLCRYTDSSAQAFPSQSTLCKKTGIKSRTTIINALKELMYAGLLDVQAQYGKKGEQKQNLYTVFNEPNQEIINKYAVTNKQERTPISTNNKAKMPRRNSNFPTKQISTHVQQMDTPCSANGHTPCSADEHPPVQQMDTPCSADGHKEVPKEKIQSLKTSSSFPSTSKKSELGNHVEEAEDKTVELLPEHNEVSALTKIDSAADVIELYHELCPSYPKLEGISQERKQAISDLRKCYSNDMEKIKRLFSNAENSSYLKGDNQRKWFADFDWLISPSNSIKVLEGKYLDKRTNLGANRSEGGPSYDIEDYVRLSMQCLYREAAV